MSDKKIVLKKKNPVVRALQWVLVTTVSVLLIIYFLVFDTTGGQKTPIIGKVDGTPIYYTRESAYGVAYLQLVEQYRSFGIEPTGAMLKSIDDMAFRNAVRSILLTDLAKKNIIVSDSFIVDAMKSQFVGTNGVFNQVQYDTFLRDSTQTEKVRIQRSLEDTILVETVQSELFRRLKPSKLAVKREYTRLNTKRVVEVGYIDVKNMVYSKEIDDATITTFFNDNKTNFVQADISIISINDSIMAEDLYNKISAGTISFADAAKENDSGLSKNLDGRLGYITKYEALSPGISDLVFTSSATNTLLSPIYGDNTSYLVYLHDIRVPDTASLVNADTLKKEYLNKNVASLIEVEKDNISNMLSVAIKGNEDLDKYGLVYSTVASPFYYGEDNIIDTNNESVYGSGESIFYNYAFSTKVGETSMPLKIKDGVAIIRVLSEIKPEFTDDSMLGSVQNSQIMRISEEWTDKAILKAKIKRNDNI